MWPAVETLSPVVQASLHAYDGYMTTIEYMNTAQQMQL